LPLLGWQANTTTPSFFSVEMGVSQSLFPRLTWNHHPPDLSLLWSLEWQVHVTVASYWMRGSPTWLEPQYSWS
jgi:hypothetical protein